MLLLCFTVPTTHLEEVKNAVFAAGAGRYQDYECSCWQTPGHGQFQALSGSNPFIGEKGKVEVVEEYKVETFFQEQYQQQVIKALKQAHPYEEPAYQIWPVLS
ncbi:NGG1p interacting factor NIF3 [Spongorhabdus nitratireducens]